MTRALTVDEVLALPALVGVRDAAGALGGLGEATAYREIAARRFPLEPIRLGARIMFRRADLLALLGITPSPTPTGDPHDVTGDAPRMQEGASHPTHDAPASLRSTNLIGELNHGHSAQRPATQGIEHSRPPAR